MKILALFCLAASCAAQTAATGSISGRVLDENQQPVPGAQVFRIEKRYDHGALRYFTGNGVFADDAGVYHLMTVPSGAAFLVETQSRLIQTSTDGDAPANTFYPNVLSPDVAAEIVLTPGEAREGVDIHRARLPTYCVAGSVDAAPEAALQLQLLDLLVHSPRGESPNTIGKTKSDGAFRVCGLHRGQYLLMATGAVHAAEQIPFFAAASITITNADVRDVKLPHSSLAPISAEFVWDDDPPAQSPKASGVLTLQSPSGGFNLAFNVPGSFSGSGPLQPDDYAIDLLRGLTEPGQYIKEISCGGRSVLNGTAPLGVGVSCGALRLVVGHDGGSLTTRVEDKEGFAIEGAYVAIVPAWAATENEMSALMTIGQTGPNGIFITSTLRPGKYRVLATREVIDLASNRVDKLWAAHSHGEEVEIAPNAGAQIKLEPQPLR